jgi:GNAT superfamily N-acetyltransferase
MLLASSLRFEPAAASDLEQLVRLRIEAMRESLERIGRFDPARARERFASGFSPERTRHILFEGRRVGFLTVKPRPDHLLLDHLYIQPDEQGRGIGGEVLKSVCRDADAMGIPVKVGALRDSDANRFYSRNGFTVESESEWDVYYTRPIGKPETGTGFRKNYRC